MRIMGVCILAVSFAACSNDKPEPIGEMKKEDPVVKDNPSNSTPSLPREALSTTQQVNAAKKDLADRTGVNENGILVRRASAVTWGSSAVGCPKKGMSYTQAVVPGLLVVLESGGKQYRYHGKKGAPVIFCPDHRARPPAYGPGEEVM